MSAARPAALAALAVVLLAVPVLLIAATAAHGGLFSPALIVTAWEVPTAVRITREIRHRIHRRHRRLVPSVS